MLEHYSGQVEQLLSAFGSFLRDTPDIIFFKDLNLAYVCVSNAFVRMVGLSDPAEVIGKTDYDLFNKPLAEHYMADDKRMLISGVPLESYIEPLPEVDGRPRYSSTTKALLRDSAGAVVGVYGVAKDVTREYEAKIHYDRELRYLFKLPPDAYAAVLFDITAWRVCDSRLKETAENTISRYDTIAEFIENALDAAPEAGEARRFFQSFSQDGMRELYESGKRSLTLEYLRRFRDGSRRYVQEEAHFLIDPVTGHLTIMFILLDVDAQRRERDALVRAAAEDSMTGLLNHEATMRSVSDCLTGMGEGKLHAMFVVDIDDFKNINDTFGHLTGDSVIINVANSIRGLFRETDIIGRVGGDEFLIFMKNVDRDADVCAKARELVEALQYVYQEDEIAVELSASVGVRLYDGGDKTAEELYAEADGALYQAKNQGKKRFAFAAPSEDVQNDLSAGAYAGAVHLRTLLENMDGCMLLCQVGDDIRFTYASPSVFKSMGRDKATMGAGGENFFQLVLPEDLGGLRATIFRSARSDIMMEHTYRVFARRGDGAEWRRMRCARLPEEQDGVAKVITVVTDITALKEAEEQLRFALLRSQAILDQHSVLLWEVDLSADTLSFSGAIAQELGLAGRRFPARSDGDFAAEYLADSSKPVLSRILHAIKNGENETEYTLCILDQNKKERPLKGRFRLLCDAYGKVRFAVGVMG